MSVIDPGKGILQISASANIRLVIVAPYIKSHALRKVISAKPDTVSGFTCITRWRPEDIASGVCDIEIYDDLAQCGGKLRVHPHLHAKIYSNEREHLVGSANLTGQALGWRAPGNFELLTLLPHDFPGIIDWQNLLLETSIPVTKEMRDSLLQEVNELKERESFASLPEVELPGEQTQQIWVPACTVPDRLWAIYRGQLGVESLPTSAYEAAKSDLDVFVPPKGLEESSFNAYVAPYAQTDANLSGDRQAWYPEG